ncbi:Rho GTPase activation protein [Atractiella rhizophila]|nr:Rho GTPase activation protein [Atractiella rhizophila]
MEYKNTVSKLQRNYVKKCSDLQDVVNQERDSTSQWNHHQQAHRVATPSPPPPPQPRHSPPMPMSGKEFEAALNHHNPHSPFLTGVASTESSPSPSSTPLTTNTSRGSVGEIQHSPSPNPMMVSAATSSNLRESLIAGPPTSLQQNFAANPLHATRNQVNSFIKNIKQSAQDLERPDGPNKMVRMKAEAEEADVLYRHAVHHLETLRLQRERVTKASRASVEESALDFSGTTKGVLMKWLESVSYLNSGKSHAKDKIWQRLHEISPADDASQVMIHTEFATFSEPPILYNSFFVGQCLSLLFGVSLVDYSAQFPGRPVPLIVVKCVKELDERGLNIEGLYRVSGKITSVQALTHAIEKDEALFNFDAHRHDPHTIAAVLKLYFRQLPTPLFQMSLVDRAQFLGHYKHDPPAAVQAVAKRIRRLHPTHYATLRLFCQHLYRVAAHATQNKMSISNLSQILSPVVFGEDPEQNLNVTLMMDANMALEPLLLHHQTLFPDDTPLTSTNSSTGSDGNSQNTHRSGSFTASSPPPLPPKPPSPHPSAQVHVIP